MIPSSAPSAARAAAASARSPSAWERPDAFRKVLSTIGSFVNLRGGHAYPSLIRKTEKKPLRIFLQDGERDLDNPFGNWPIANKQMHAALNT